MQIKYISLRHYFDHEFFFHFGNTILKLRKPADVRVYAQRNQCFGINADLNIFSIFEFYCPISIISTKCSQTERRRSISYFWISYWGWSKLLWTLLIFKISQKCQRSIKATAYSFYFSNIMLPTDHSKETTLGHLTFMLRVIYQGVLTIKQLKGSFNLFTHVLVSVTQFITWHNGSKLQDFYIIFFPKLFPEWKPYMANIVSRNCFLFRVQIKKKLLLKLLSLYHRLSRTRPVDNTP